MFPLQRFMFSEPRRRLNKKSRATALPGMKTSQRQQDLVGLGGYVKEQGVKALGRSGEKTLSTKQDYFGGAFKRNILGHSRPVRVKNLLLTDMMSYEMNASEWKWFKRRCPLTKSRFT